MGYHVVQACPTCLDAANNGHFFMFLCSETSCVDRTAHTDEGTEQRPNTDKQLPNHNLNRSKTNAMAQFAKIRFGRKCGFVFKVYEIKY